MAVPYQCRGCNRPVPTGNLYQGYGVVCATRRGLVPKRRRARVRQPVRTGMVQPVLFELDDEIETNDEDEE